MVTAESESFQFGSSSTFGYAIPMATASAVAADIVAGHASAAVHIGATPFLGVQVLSSTSGTPGAVIAGVVAGGPADRAGLTSGDTITAVDGVAVASPESLTALLLQKAPGTTVRVGYTDQFGRASAVDVTLGSGPPQ